jgi:hypothetical protein
MGFLDSRGEAPILHNAEAIGEVGCRSLG